MYVYALARAAEDPYGGQILRYDHRAHAVTVVAAVPDDDAVRSRFLFDVPVLPQLVLVFVVDLAAVVTKYGARGGRFALQQVGHAAQNVSLRLAVDGLRGYVLGGGQDHAVLQTLGLAHTHARFAGAMACGG